jgi:cell division protein FtsW
MKKYFQFDNVFFWLIVSLVGVGVLVFLSASFSAFSDPHEFYGLLFNQLVLGLCGGIVVWFIALRVPLAAVKKYALWVYGFGVLTLMLVFVPHLGFAHGGASRWLSLGPLSFQPVEFAKYATIIYLAAWLSSIKQNVKNISQGLVPFLIILGAVGALLLLQPDTDSFLIIAITSLMMYFVSGAKWRDIGIMLLVGVVALGGLFLVHPYLMSRVKVYLHPDRNSLSTSYQVQQQLIAIGSGKIVGRGFGQGIEKFKYLPEPLGDSVYSVIGEEFGFVGCVILIFLYLLVYFRGMMIANRSKDAFGKLLVLGIVSIIVLQSFLNIASATAVFPLGGLPLMFISHGGTALAFAIGATGLVLNVSRGQTKLLRRSEEEEEV